MDFVDEDEWEQDEPGYEEDSALVSDLFRQIAKEPPTTAESPLISDFGFEQLPEVDASDPQSMPSEIPDYADKPNKSNDRATSAESTPATTNTSIERSPKSSFSNAQKAQRILPILQAVGVTAIALFGFWGFNASYNKFLPLYPASQAVNDNLKTASTSKLQAIAIEHFHRGNLSGASLAVEELLNRGALTSAKTALNAVSDAPQTSEINFLRGRLAWQLIKTGDKNYSFDDVRRYWETAVKHKPNSPRYYSALGFVYYSQGELNKANQTWFQALYLTEEQKANKTTSTSVVAKRDQLNAYAGLALVLTKSAETQPTDKQAKLLREAIKLRQQVLTDDRLISNQIN
jgi:tetratricopeptide (TPR) repeat protein